MTTYKLKDVIEFPEFDGIHQKTILKILCYHPTRKYTFFTYSEHESVSKDEIENCIILFDNGEWIFGSELPKSLQL